MPQSDENTPAVPLVLRGQDKTGFDQNGGDINLQAGGATGEVSSLPGNVNITVGGGAYSLATAQVTWQQLNSTGPGKRGSIVSPGSIEIFGGGSGLSQNQDEVSFVVDRAIPIVFTPTEIETQSTVDITNVDGTGSLGVALNRHNRMQPFNYISGNQLALCFSFGDVVPTSKAGEILVKGGTNLSFNSDNVILNGTGSQLAVDATKGFAYLPTCSGAPTGTPQTSVPGAVAAVVDITGPTLYLYVGGAWKSA